MIHPLQFLFIIQKGQVQNGKLYCLTCSNLPTAYTLAINLFGGISTLTDLNLLQACAIIDNLLREGALFETLKLSESLKVVKIMKIGNNW